MDPYLSLLEYRNTPVESPAQLLMSRHLCSVLPITIKQLQPELACHSTVQSRRNLCETQQRQYYNRNAKALPTLPVGATVCYQLPAGTRNPVTVIESAWTQRSYNILTDKGHTLRRNRGHLLQTPKGDTSQAVPPNSHRMETEDTKPETLHQDTEHASGTQPSPIRSPQSITQRSGHIVRSRDILDL